MRKSAVQQQLREQLIKITIKVTECSSQFDFRVKGSTIIKQLCNRISELLDLDPLKTYINLIPQFGRQELNHSKSLLQNNISNNTVLFAKIQYTSKSISNSTEKELLSKSFYASAEKESLSKSFNVSPIKESLFKSFYASAGKESLSKSFYDSAGKEFLSKSFYASAEKESLSKSFYASAGKESLSKSFYSSAGNESLSKSFYGNEGYSIKTIKELFGLKVVGICTNQICIAYDKEVTVLMGYNKFDVNLVFNKTKCPSCPYKSTDMQKPITVTNLILTNCFWKFGGHFYDPNKFYNYNFMKNWIKTEGSDTTIFFDKLNEKNYVDPQLITRAL